MLKNTLYILTILAFIFGLVFYIIKDNSKFKLASLMLSKSLPKVIEDFSTRSCNNFSEKEKKLGSFEALVTGYCKPNSKNFKIRFEFLCAVGLNCNCPNGREENLACGNGNLKWAACKDFDDKKTAYCNQTATLSLPKPGTVAADWTCFKPKSKITIGNKIFEITDKGSAIKGRRLDLWFDSCQDAFNAIGIYQVQIPK